MNTQTSHPPKEIAVVCALIEDSARGLLLAQRPPGKHLAGLWEFPGGKIEPDETPSAALAREINEELGCEIALGAALRPVTHTYPERTIRLLPFRARLLASSPVPHGREGQALRWVARHELPTLPMPAADAPILAEWLAATARESTL